MKMLQKACLEEISPHKLATFSGVQSTLMSPVGPSRHFAAMQRYVGYRAHSGLRQAVRPVARDRRTFGLQEWSTG